MSVKFYPLPFSVTLWCADIALQSVKPPKKKKKKKAQKAEAVLSAVIYIYIYIYIWLNFEKGGSLDFRLKTGAACSLFSSHGGGLKPRGGGVKGCLGKLQKP